MSPDVRAGGKFKRGLVGNLPSVPGHVGGGAVTGLPHFHCRAQTSHSVGAIWEPGDDGRQHRDASGQFGGSVPLQRSDGRAAPILRVVHPLPIGNTHRLCCGLSPIIWD